MAAETSGGGSSEIVGRTGEYYGAQVQYRLVIPRVIPFSQSNRVQQAAWKKGYGTRLAGRDGAKPTAVVVEFLRVIDQLPEPSEVGDLEHALEEILGSDAVAASFTGSGAWIETVAIRPPSKDKSRSRD